MTLLYNHPCFLQHETGYHPERAERLRCIARRLDATGLAVRCRRPEFLSSDRRQLARLHSQAYINEIWALAKTGGGYIEGDTLGQPHFLLRRPTGRRLRLRRRRAECSPARTPRPSVWFARPAITPCPTAPWASACSTTWPSAALRAVDELGLDRVLVVDWDVHHGNGTQAAFWEDPRVGFLSIHRWPFYPGTGDADEIGAGRGLGTTLNLPVPFGIARKEYLTLLAHRLEAFAAKIKPQLVLISAGFDAHRSDPVGDLGLESEDFIAMTDAVLDVAAAYAGGRVVSVLEGGYHLEALAESVALHLERMLQRSWD